MDHSTLYLSISLQNGILLQQDKQTTLLFQTFHLALLDVSSVDHNSRETGSTETATNALVLHGGEETDRAIFKFISSPQVLMSPL